MLVGRCNDSNSDLKLEDLVIRDYMMDELDCTAERRMKGEKVFGFQKQHQLLNFRIL